jgi:hypothetical protein
MLETFRGIRTLRYLWHEQRGLCAECNIKITRITGWRLHYRVPRVSFTLVAPHGALVLEIVDPVARARICVLLSDT